MEIQTLKKQGNEHEKSTDHLPIISVCRLSSTFFLTMELGQFQKILLLCPGGEDTPYNGLCREAPPGGVSFSGFRYSRVGISQVEVYKRVGKSVIRVYERAQKG